MEKYEAALFAMDTLTVRIHNQSIRSHPDHDVIKHLQEQLDKVTEVFKPDMKEEENEH